MTNALQTGASWLADRLHASASADVVYSRGTSATSLTATLGSQLLRVTDRNGNTKVERTDRDFIVRAADLTLDGIQVEPQRGDHFDLTTNGVTERFEVMAPQGEAPWRYSDPHKLMVRIHSKYLGVVSGPQAVTDESPLYILGE